MSKQNKELAKIFASPTPKNITFNEIKSFLGGLGYKEKKGNGSRRKFIHKERSLIITIHEPHPNKEVLSVYIDQIKEHLIDNKLVIIDKNENFTL